MNYLELLQQKMIEELSKEIGKKGTTINPTAEEVFQNLDLLYEEKKQIEFGEPNGNIIKYMPKRFKEMVMRLISPTCALLSNIERHEDCVTATAHLYYDRHDTKPIASAKATYFYERMDTNLTEAEKRSTAELAARGLAESKCLQKFGIGAWFKGEYEAEEDPEAIKTEPIGGSFEPTVALEPTTENEESIPSSTEPQAFVNDFFSQPEVSAKAEFVEEQMSLFPDTAKNIPQTENITEDELPFISVPEDNIAEENNDSAESISYEEALLIKADIGKARSKGLNLGEVLAQFPQNLVWMYGNNCSEEVKIAIRVIAEHEEKLRNLFTAQNITI